MKPVFSGPSGRKPWKRPKKYQLEKVGDSINVRGGTMHVMAIDETGLARIEARSNAGEVLTFYARRNDNGDWVEEIKMGSDPIPKSYLEMMGAQKSLPSFDPNILDKFAPDLSLPGQGWLNGFGDAAMSQRHPFRADAVNAHSSPVSSVIDHIDGKLQQTKREKARIERRLARAKIKAVRHRRWEPPTPEEYQADVQRVVAALKGGMKLEKPQGSSLHHFRQYLEESTMDNMDDDEVDFLMNEFQSVVIEHDWAAAFANVPGMLDEGEVPMPFDATCFEFRISGLRLLVMMLDKECFLVTGINNRWYVSDERFYFHDNGTFTLSGGGPITRGGFAVSEAQQFLAFLGQQIRAACIMLDAGVAEADAQEPSPALNKHRAKRGQSPLKAYHVVRLHRKHAPRGEVGPATGRHVRAHVRRGHWRHYQDGGSGHEQFTDKDGYLRSRTWINWMVVGDINLGFVDKEYRL